MNPQGVPQGYQLVPLPEKKKFIIKATIPTVQYGNLQPEYEVEAESYEAAEAIAMPYIEKLWDRYCAKGSELPKKQVEETEEKPKGKVVLVKMESDFTSSYVCFDEVNHKYYNKEGKPYLSGSKFAKKYEHEFEKDKILEMMEKKHGESAEDISAMWALKGEVSTNLGTAIHAALEMYGKYVELGKKLGSGKKPVVNTALHDHSIIQPIVEAFFKDRKDEDAEYEVLVANDKLMWCGQIDRLKIIDRKKKICRVQDYKTNVDVNKKGFNKTLLAPFDNMPDTPLSGYWLQLSFYARLLKEEGWTVEGLDVIHLDGLEWVTYTREPIDLTDF